MSSQGRSIYNDNPGTFDATQTGVSIGDLVVDPAGVNPPGLVTGPNSARSVTPLGGAPAGNTVTVSQPSPSSANRNVNFLVKDGSGAPVPDAPVSVAFVVSPNAATPSITVGAGSVLAGSAGKFLGFGVTDAAGNLTLLVNGTPGNTIVLQYGSGAAGGSLSTTIP